MEYWISKSSIDSKARNSKKRKGICTCLGCGSIIEEFKDLAAPTYQIQTSEAWHCKLIVGFWLFYDPFQKARVLEQINRLHYHLIGLLALRDTHKISYEVQGKTMSPSDLGNQVQAEENLNFTQKYTQIKPQLEIINHILTLWITYKWLSDTTIDNYLNYTREPISERGKCRYINSYLNSKFTYQEWGHQNT